MVHLLLHLLLLHLLLQSAASATAVTWTTRGAWSAHGALGSMPLGTGRTGPPARTCGWTTRGCAC